MAGLTGRLYELLPKRGLSGDGRKGGIAWMLYAAPMCRFSGLTWGSEIFRGEWRDTCAGKDIPRK